MGLRRLATLEDARMAFTIFLPQVHRRDGFTLLEALIVLAVLSILVGIALPPLARAQRRFGAYTAARELRADVTHARIRAILDGATVRVVMDTASARYRVERADRTLLRVRELPPGIVLRTSAHRQEIVFSARGTSNLYSTTWIGVGGDADAHWHGLRVIPTGALEVR